MASVIHFLSTQYTNLMSKIKIDKIIFSVVFHQILNCSLIVYLQVSSRSHCDIHLDSKILKKIKLLLLHCNFYSTCFYIIKFMFSIGQTCVNYNLTPLFLVFWYLKCLLFMFLNKSIMANLAFCNWLKYHLCQIDGRFSNKTFKICKDTKKRTKGKMNCKQLSSKFNCSLMLIVYIHNAQFFFLRFYGNESALAIWY